MGQHIPGYFLMFSTACQGLYNAEAIPSKDKKQLGFKNNHIHLSIPNLHNADLLTFFKK